MKKKKSIEIEDNEGNTVCGIRLNEDLEVIDTKGCEVADIEGDYLFKTEDDLIRIQKVNKQLPRGRNYTDSELERILDKMDEGSLKALQFGMVETEIDNKEMLSSKDVSRLMTLNEEINDKKHY